MSKSKSIDDVICSKVLSINSMYLPESISSCFASSTGFTPGLFSILTYDMMSPFFISLVVSSCFAARMCCGIVFTYSD